MRVLITAGPTREFIDTVRFLTNASSGRMGIALAEASLEAGHDVTLLLGPTVVEPPPDADVIRFVSCSDLADRLAEHFCRADVLLMAAAVGDFRPERTFPSKLHRRNGPITIRLYPTEDILAGLAASKRSDQTIVSFSVEDGRREDVEKKAREEMVAKRADLCVVNPPSAMDSGESDACLLGREGMAIPWAHRTKTDLAREIVALLGGGDR